MIYTKPYSIYLRGGLPYNIHIRGIWGRPDEDYSIIGIYTGVPYWETTILRTCANYVETFGEPSSQLLPDP